MNTWPKGSNLIYQPKRLGKAKVFGQPYSLKSLKIKRIIDQIPQNWELGSVGVVYASGARVPRHQASTKRRLCPVDKRRILSPNLGQQQNRVLANKKAATHLLPLFC